MKGRQFPDYSFSSAASNSSLIRSHQRCSMKEGVLRNVTKFTGKHLCQSLFFNKVAGSRHATLLKKRLWHRRSPVSFMKFLRTPFLLNTSGWLFLFDNPRMCWFCRVCLSPQSFKSPKVSPFSNFACCIFRFKSLISLNRFSNNLASFSISLILFLNLTCSMSPLVN